MKIWLLLLGGLLVWTVHFFGLYLIEEFGGGRAAELLSFALTFICLGAITSMGVVLIKVREPWLRTIGLTGAVLGLIAVAWQGLPLLLV